MYKHVIIPFILIWENKEYIKYAYKTFYIYYVLLNTILITIACDTRRSRRRFKMSRKVELYPISKRAICVNATIYSCEPFGNWTNIEIAGNAQNFCIMSWRLTPSHGHVHAHQSQRRRVHEYFHLIALIKLALPGDDLWSSAARGTHTPITDIINCNLFLVFGSHCVAGEISAILCPELRKIFPSEAFYILYINDSRIL